MIVSGNGFYKRIASLKIKDYEIRKMSKDDFFPLMKNLHEKVFSEDLSYNPNSILNEHEKNRLAALAEYSKDRFELHLGVFKGEEFIGWHFGYQVNQWEFYMCNTGVLEEHRRNGIYTSLLEFVLSECKQAGFQEISSRHNASNNQVIIPKLKSGFVISSLEISDVFGTLVQLKYYTNPKRKEIIDFRTGQKAPSSAVKLLFDL